MNTNLFIGIGAGLASALLFLSVTTGNPAAVMLFYAAPLPLFIAGFGWGLFPTLVAAAIATVTTAVVAHFIFAGIYIVSCAVPCVWLVRMALLSRPLDESDPQGPREWYPAGRLALWAAAFGAGVAIASIVIFGGTAESYAVTINTAFRTMLGGSGAPLPSGANLDVLIGIMTTYLAPVSAALWTLFALLNMWLAIRIAAMSGHAIRPSIGLRDMRFAQQASAAFAAALAGAYIGGTVGLYAKAVLGALVAVFAVLGIAVIYSVTRGMAAQPFIVAGVILSAMLIPFVVLIIALIGIGDTIFDFRNRRSGPPAVPGGE